MTELRISGRSGASAIHIDSSVAVLADLRRGRRMVVITDENVARHHGSVFPSCDELIVVPAGESSKNLEHVARLYERLIDAELDRNVLLVGIGGGMVTDLTGFVAATFLRGVSFGFVATTVLAQVDAAIGGKNGVNIKGYKNLVGTITQPEFVINDTATLATLDTEQLINGLSEVVKSGLIADAGLFEMMESEGPQMVVSRGGRIGEAIGRAAQVKVDVVNRDEFETGDRRLLNLGHTYGHAVEKITRMHHGFAVSVGTVVAAQISVQRGMLPATEAVRIEKTLAALGLPTRVDLNTSELMDAMRKDKKRQSDSVNYVLLDRIGHAVVVPIGYDELKRTLDDLR